MFLPFVIVCSALATQGQPQAPPAAAATTAESATVDTSSTDTARDLPVSIDRIQRALSRPPAIRLKGNQSVFRVEVLGKRLTIEEILGPDYLKGPVPRAPMTHQEFLNMVTPKDYQGYAAFSNREGVAVAASSFALKWALQKAIHKYQTAHEEREREAARKEVQDALMELDKARIKAGLSPR
jgi:phosphopantetheinyl transferase (holo-ACP synthase)